MPVGLLLKPTISLNNLHLHFQVRQCITSTTYIQKNIFRYGSPRHHILLTLSLLYAIPFLREGTEDALHLNIYSPSFALGGGDTVGNITQGEDDTLGNIAQGGHDTVGNKALLPVMVFFHGGGFVSGSGSRLLYGPELLLDKGVLLVFFFTFFYYKPRSTI